MFPRFVALIAILLVAISSSYADDYHNRDCQDLYDPLEPVNRKIFTINSALDYALLRPLARGYTNSVPAGGRAKIGNFVDNFTTPITFVNNILQLDFQGAAKSFWKFAINSTFGILGFNDLTTKRGLKVSKQTFGSTLAYYGARPGAYIVLPLYGSTNMRDMWDVLMMNKSTNPVTYQVSSKIYTGILIGDIIHTRSTALPFTDNIARTSTDPYATIRSVLHQKREGRLNYPERYKCIQYVE
jgi:phospholipid-binding lipoprotein MlaA